MVRNVHAMKGILVSTLLVYLCVQYHLAVARNQKRKLTAGEFLLTLYILVNERNLFPSSRFQATLLS